MFWTVFRFEIAYWLKRPLSLLFFGLFLFIAFTTTGIEGFSHATGATWINSSYTIAQAMAELTAIGQIITTAIAGSAVLRDAQLGTEEMLFTTRLSKTGYLGGRFTGAVVVMVLIYLALPLGLLAGMVMPWLPADKLGPVSLGLVFQPFMTIALPNVLFASAVFFAIGALTRKLFAVYISGFVMFVGWTITSEIAAQIDKVALGALLDPFALTTIDLATRYWSIAEKNSRLIPFDGVMLQNRLLWIAVALGLFAIVAAVFRLRLQHAGARRPKPGVAEVPPLAVPVPVVSLRYDRAAWRRAFVTQIVFHVRSIVREAAFLSIAAIAVVTRLVNVWFTAHPQESVRWPVTSIVAERMATGSFLFVIILATLYGGELVWRERQLKIDQIQDTAPVPDWVIFAGKLVAVFLAIAGLFLVQIGAAMAMQLALGYSRLQPGLYFQVVALGGLPIVLALVALAVGVHAIVNQKFVAHLIVIGYWLALPLLSNSGFDHRLYQVGLAPFFTFSDMNGWGPFAGRVAAQGFYSVTVCLLLATVGYLVLVRGTDEGWLARRRSAALRWRHGAAVAAGVFGVAAVGLGGFFFFNVNVLNAYTEVREAQAVSKAWELKYKPLEGLPQPRLVAASLRQDYFPERRAASWSGTLTAVNRHDKPIDTLFISFPGSAPTPSDRFTARTNSGLALDSLTLDRPATLMVDDTLGGVRLYRFAKPLARGESLSVRFAGHFEPRGFPNDAFNNDVAANGSFMNSQYVPGFGYREGNELPQDDVRRRNGLQPKARMKLLDDPAVRLNNYITSDADWIAFDATVCTSQDQIALAPGYLDREWTENGRKCFHYAMDRPILNFYSTLSARYSVTRASHNGVALEIYHIPEHAYAIPSMLQGTKDGLDYFSANFSPYLYRQFRIIEFPRYASFAQAFPNTIPYSEGVGFLHRKEEGDDKIDLAYFVTAHELAHQWWAHQVIGGDGQGSTMFSEGLAEYSALTVMEKRFGREAAQKFLRRELDGYLRGRGAEEKKEVPLLYVENQPYIHYQKGSLAFYALRDYIGEPAMNNALRAFLRKWALKGPPYPTARDLYAELERATPDSLKYVLTDLFREITLYENKADTATATKRADGSWDVRLVLRSRKLKGDSAGNTSEVPIADYVDIGIFGERVPGQKLGAPLLVKKVRVTQAVTVVDLIVPREPLRAGIDPYNKLIDRTPEDNVIAVRRDRP
jgi:ABC-2 type transport system permease protein